MCDVGFNIERLDLGDRAARSLAVMNYGEYRDKCVLVTGGLGFIESNLVIRLVELGARVTIVDSLAPGCGGNRANLDSVIGAVQIKLADIRDVESLAAGLQRPEIVFNLAGAVSHSGSMEAPLRDLELNTWAQPVFLSKCADRFPGIRIVYAGTRQVYGAPQSRSTYASDRKPSYFSSKIQSGWSHGCSCARARWERIGGTALP